MSNLVIALSESDPPTLTSFSIDTNVVTVGEIDQAVKFTVGAEDESGVDWSNPDTKLEFNDPSGISYYINFSVEAPHVASYTFSSDSKSGVWSVGEVRLVDTLDNRSYFYAKSGDLGTDTTVEVIGGAESDPPTLTSFSIDTNVVTVGEIDQAVKFTVGAEDESGVDWSNPDTKLEFNDPSGISYYINFSVEAPHVASYTFSSDSKSGVWSVGEVRLVDTLDNRSYFYAKSGDLGTDTTVEVIALDTDFDSISNCNDADNDNDGVADEADDFPLDSTESIDSDSDGLGNNADLDDDDDGFTDEEELADGTDPLSRFSCRSGCFSFDVDESLQAQPLTDGLLVIRHLFGFSGDALTSGAVASDANRDASEVIASYLTDADTQLDIDGDGESKPLTDGLLLIRYLFGFSGGSLVSGAIGTDATRNTADAVEAYIKERVPSD